MPRLRERKEIRSYSPKPPKGGERFKWYGPGLIWMTASVGSGAVLFTPRIGSRYGYELLWLVPIVVFLMWVMIREVGWYTIATGKTIMDGYGKVPGPKGWAIWLIFLPQVVAGVLTISGIAALTGSTLMIAFPGSLEIYTTIVTILSAVLVVSGQYKVVERATTIMAGLLVAAAVITAARVFPAVNQLAAGLMPSIPEDFDLEFVLPWVGFMLAGSAGIMWFSYWVSAREYGGPMEDNDEDNNEAEDLDEEYREWRNFRLKQWIQIMSTTAAIGAIGGGIVVIAFLILGTQLLRPEGVIPEGIQVAQDLTQLLSQVWGNFGFWLMIVGVVIALAGTLLTNQDGWGRLFADCTLILFEPQMRNLQAEHDNNGNNLQQWIFSNLTDRKWLTNAYAIWAVTILPLIVFFIVRDPVEILSWGGIVTVIHNPVVVFLTLFVNRQQLPKAMQPGLFSFIFMIVSGIFFTGFAILYFFDLFGI